MDVLRKGWHPEKNSDGKEKWLHDNRGVKKMKGLVGRDTEKSHLEQARNHVSKPLSSLQDPASFGAPPKRVDQGGDDNANAGMSASTSAASSSVAPPAVPQMASSRPGPPVPSRRETVPSSSSSLSAKPPAPEDLPSGPFRADTTGLSTSNLPPPPVHRDRRVVEPARGKPSPPSRLQASTIAGPADPISRPGPPAPPAKPKPSLPPRTAVAGGRQRDEETERSPPPPYRERPEPPQGSPGPVAVAAPAVNELQARFARMRASQEDGGSSRPEGESEDGLAAPAVSPAPPPVPLGTKPR